MGLFDKFFGRSKKLTQKQFAKQLMELIREMGEKRPLRFDEESFSIQNAEEESGFVFNLANVYDEHCSVEKEEREDHLRFLAGTWFVQYQELPDDIDDVGVDLLP